MPQKTFFALIAVFVIALVIGRRFNQEPGPARVGFSTFLQTIESSPGAVKPNTLRIETGAGTEAEFTGRWQKDDQKFATTGYISEPLLDRLNGAGVTYELAVAGEGDAWQRMLMSWLPMVVFAVLMVFVLRSLQSGGGKLMSFGKSRAQRVSPDKRRVTFADVAGIDEAREEIEEIVSYLHDPSRFTRLGGRVPRGVLIMGPPGTGKTLLARAIAGEAGVPFFSISGSDFVEMFVGVGASRVRDLFDQGKKSAPCIIFIDEIDAVGRQRGTGYGGGHDEREQTLNQLLVEMDGFAPNDGVILIAATNRPDVLDPALLRPGRFDRRLVVPRPDVRGREGILRVHTKKTPLGPDVDLAVIARGTSGMAGADLENLVNEAALQAARGDKNALAMEDFEKAKDKVLMGPERRSLVISATDKRITAFHEAGHALVAHLMKASDPVYKVTIVPRGRALGMTQQLPLEDRLSLSKDTVNDQIALTMGGRVAEELMFHQITTGAANDIQVATDLARKMVCQWGMSEAIGPIHLGRRDEAVFLGRDFAEPQGYSQRTARIIDDEIRLIIGANHDRARHLIVANMDKLNAVAEALLEFEVLDQTDLQTLFAGKKLDRRSAAAGVADSTTTVASAPTATPALGLALRAHVIRKAASLGTVMVLLAMGNVAVGKPGRAAGPAPDAHFETEWRWVQSQFPEAVQYRQLPSRNGDLARLLSWGQSKDDTVNVYDRSCRAISMVRKDDVLTGFIYQRTAVIGAKFTTFEDQLLLGERIRRTCGSTDMYKKAGKEDSWVKDQIATGKCAPSVGHMLSAVTEDEAWYGGAVVRLSVRCTRPDQPGAGCPAGGDESCGPCDQWRVVVQPAGPAPPPCPATCPASQPPANVRRAQAAVSGRDFLLSGLSTHPYVFRLRAACEAYRKLHPPDTADLRPF